MFFEKLIKTSLVGRRQSFNFVADFENLSACGDS
jgi:hypothetical protein